MKPAREAPVGFFHAAQGPGATVRALLLVLALELAYALLTRVGFAAWLSGSELELAIAAARLLSLAACWKLFRPLILSRRPLPAARYPEATWFAIGLLLALPLLCGDDGRPAWPDQVVFGLTSFVVGPREEIVYRAVIQNLLERHLGLAGAVILASLVFVLYHYGYPPGMPFTAWRAVLLFSCGLAFGLLYRASGSLLLVSLLHAVLDLLWALSPWVVRPLGNEVELALCLGAVCLLLGAVRSARA
jgi:membrane protease YdiL (CAAX protease family)